jgi:hypothetical protein
MWGTAAWGVTRGSPDAWGYLLWVSLWLLGALFIAVVGHGLLFGLIALPFIAVYDAWHRRRNGRES